jgi:hypothetical protein
MHRSHHTGIRTAYDMYVYALSRTEVAPMNLPKDRIGLLSLVHAAA